MKLNSRWTPINKNYETCSETYVELLIYPECNANKITELLNLKPSELKNKGDITVNSIGRKREAKNTFWVLSSLDSDIDSKDARDHLSWLLNQLIPKKKQLQEIQSMPNTVMAVKCIWWSVGCGGPTLWPEQMSALAELNLELSFSIYLSDEDED